MAAVQINGFCDDQFKAVEQVFRENFTREIGASFVVISKGKLVVDLWGGFCDAQRIKPWEKDTIVNVWSTTKIMTALCLHILVDRGLIDLDAPVSKYWPEFAQASKQKLPVRYLLCHCSGVSGFNQQIPVEALFDWDRMCKMLAAQAPWWTPGTRSGYQSISFGYLVGNLVKIVSGKSLGTFFRDEIARPLQIDFHIGTPEVCDNRIADLVGDRIPGWQKAFVSIFAPTSAKVMFRPDPNIMTPLANSREWRAAEIPSSNGHGNARSVAQVGAILANGGIYEGKKILDAKTIENALQLQIKNRDKVIFMPIEWALGFQLNPRYSSLGNRSFSWNGYGGSLCVMDREKEISAAYAMNRLYLIDKRAVKLIQAVKRCL